MCGPDQSPARVLKFRNESFLDGYQEIEHLGAATDRHSTLLRALAEAYCRPPPAEREWSKDAIDVYDGCSGSHMDG